MNGKTVARQEGRKRREREKNSQQSTFQKKNEPKKFLRKTKTSTNEANEMKNKKSYKIESLIRGNKRREREKHLCQVRN